MEMAGWEHWTSFWKLNEENNYYSPFIYLLKDYYTKAIDCIHDEKLIEKLGSTKNTALYGNKLL